MSLLQEALGCFGPGTPWFSLVCSVCWPVGTNPLIGDTNPMRLHASSIGWALGFAAVAVGCDGRETPTPGATGGFATGAASTGGAATGGATGGTAMGGSATGGTVTGGAPDSGGATGTGGSAGSGGSTSPGTGPCDLYAAASPATPCVAAYSTVRALLGAYRGPLYQVRKGGSSLGTGGTTQDIGVLADGFADAAAQDTFCNGSTCAVSILYDQSGRGNDLKVAPAGCYSGTGSEPDYESSATKRSLSISGHKVYALYMAAHDGYRNNTTSGIPTGNAAQGIYEVVDGKRYGGTCCWEFGNASTDNCYGGTGRMNALFFGSGYWGSGGGPWFMADFGAGPWDGNPVAGVPENPDPNPAITFSYALGILKTSTAGSTPQCAIRVGNAQFGGLVTAYDGMLTSTFALEGGIILGIGSDNSNSSYGTFYEGAITAGRPSDAADAAVLANVQAAKYGQ